MSMPQDIVAQLKSTAENNNALVAPSTSTSSQSDTRTFQQKVDEVFISRIQCHDHVEFEEVIAKYHADINAMQVKFEAGDTSDAPPIIYAIRNYNRRAFKRLLALGARLDIKDKKGNLPIAQAVAFGDDDMVRDLLFVGAKLDFKDGEGNALHSALRNVRCFSLARYTEWDGEDEGRAMSKALLAWFEGGKKPAIDSLSGVYWGNKDLVQLIFDHSKGLIVGKDPQGHTPLELLKNPTLCLNHFYDAAGKPIHCEIGEDNTLILRNFYIYNRDMEDSILVKELKYNRSAVLEILEGDPNSELEVLKKQFEAKNAAIEQKLKEENQKNFKQSQAEQNKLLDAKLQEEATQRRKSWEAKKQADDALLKENFAKFAASQKEHQDKQSTEFSKFKKETSDSLSKQSSPNALLDQRIAKLNAEAGTERFFDKMSHELIWMLNTYCIAAQAVFKMDKKTTAQKANDVLGWLGTHAPTPFGAIVSIISFCTGKALEQRELKRYQKIASLLPAGADELSPYLKREIIVPIAEQIAKKMGDRFKFMTQEEGENFAKVAFVAALSTIYEVDNLNINEKLMAERRQAVLASAVLGAVTHAPAFKYLLEKTQVAVMGRHKTTFYTQIQESLKLIYQNLKIATETKNIQEKHAAMLVLLRRLPNSINVKKLVEEFCNRKDKAERLRALDAVVNNKASANEVANDLCQIYQKQIAACGTIVEVEQFAKRMIPALFTTLCSPHLRFQNSADLIGDLTIAVVQQELSERALAQKELAQQGLSSKQKMDATTVQNTTNTTGPTKQPSPRAFMQSAMHPATPSAIHSATTGSTATKGSTPTKTQADSNSGTYSAAHSGAQSKSHFLPLSVAHSAQQAASLTSLSSTVSTALSTAHGASSSSPLSAMGASSSVNANSSSVSGANSIVSYHPPGGAPIPLGYGFDDPLGVLMKTPSVNKQAAAQHKTALK